MNKSIRDALSKMGVAAIALTLLILIFVACKNMLFFGAFIAAGLLVLDLLFMILFVLIAIIFKVESLSKLIKCTAITFIALLVGIPLIMKAANPLHRDSESLRNNILKLTPIGSSMEDVIAVIESNEKWGNPYIDYDHGYPEYGETRIGVQSIRVSLGEYYDPFIVFVTAFWGFDNDGKLVDIHVQQRSPG